MNETPSSSKPAVDCVADAIGAALPSEANSEQAAGQPAIVEAARRVGETILGPSAEESDQLGAPNRANFQALSEAGILGMAISSEYGGLEATAATQRAVTQTLASYCGVTTFVQAQHHGPCRIIAAGPNERLKRELLPKLARGARQCGISFAHLRRPGPPVLRADPVEGGYRLNGTAPWVTGWGLIDQLVFGATLPDGRFVYLWSPADRAQFPEIFNEMELPSEAGALVASPPLKLCAMNASATVEISCKDWFIPREHWLSESDRETMRRSDRNGVLGATAMPLGCTAASIRTLCSAAERRGIAAVHKAAAAFGAEYEDLQGQVEEWNFRSGQTGVFERSVALRAWSIDLAVRAAHAAVTASSGSANLLSHPAQRLLREAMFYTIQAQTHEVMEATLERLRR